MGVIFFLSDGGEVTRGRCSRILHCQSQKGHEAVQPNSLQCPGGETEAPRPSAHGAEAPPQIPSGQVSRKDRSPDLLPLWNWLVGPPPLKLKAPQKPPRDPPLPGCWLSELLS